MQPLLQFYNLIFLGIKVTDLDLFVNYAEDNYIALNA